MLYASYCSDWILSRISLETEAAHAAAVFLPCTIFSAFHRLPEYVFPCPYSNCFFPESYADSLPDPPSVLRKTDFHNLRAGPPVLYEAYYAGYNPRDKTPWFPPGLFAPAASRPLLSPVRYNAYTVPRMTAQTRFGFFLTAQNFLPGSVPGNAGNRALPVHSLYFS